MLTKSKRNKIYEQMLGLEELEVYDRREISGKVYFYVGSKNEAGVCPTCGKIVEDIKE